MLGFVIACRVHSTGWADTCMINGMSNQAWDHRELDLDMPVLVGQNELVLKG